MNKTVDWIVCVAIALTAATTGAASAQTRSIPGETEVVTATVEAIDRSSRDLTLKLPDGEYQVLHVPDGYVRFDSLKVGDRITARYYDNMVLRMKRPGEADVNDSSENVTRGPGTATGTAGTSARQRTITATVTAIDPKVPSITFSGPNGWRYSSRARDKEALKGLKVGDRVDITWTTAVILSVDQGK